MPDQIPIKRFRLGPMESYEVLVNDFDRIETEAMGIGTDIAFFTACLPVAITLHITLRTVTPVDLYVRESFTLLMWVCYLGAIYFGVRAYRQRGRLKMFMQRIRNTQVPPLGEKGSEISPSEMEQMASGEQTAENDTHPEGQN
jgi:hypothetical protein